MTGEEYEKDWVPSDNWSWYMRTAYGIGETTAQRNQILFALEAAGEMKTVKLKVLLGRCYEIIGIADTNRMMPQQDDDFLKEIKDALK